MFAESQKAASVGMKATGVAANVASIGVKALSIAMNTFIAIAATFIVTKVVKGIDYVAKSSERAKKKTEELRQEIQDINSTYTSNRQTLTDLKSEYDSLTKKIGDSSAKVALSADEYDRYKDIQSQILGITPKLITGWDNEGNAISNKNGLLQQSIDLLDEEYKKDLRNRTSKSQNEDYAKDVIAERTEFESDASTKTTEGTAYDLQKNFRKLLNDHKGENDYDGYDIANELYKYYFPNDGDLEGDAWAYRDGYVGKLIDLIGQKLDSEKFANSFSDENNPIRKMFSQSEVDDLIEDAGSYFTAADRILDEGDAINQKLIDQMNNNAEYQLLSVDPNSETFDEQARSNIYEYIKGLDYASMSEEEFAKQASETKKIIKDMSNDKDLLDTFNNIFNPQEDDEDIDSYIKRVQSSVVQMTDYFEKNGLTIPVSFSTDIDNQLNDLKEKRDYTINRFAGDTATEATKEAENELADAKANLENEFSKISDWGLDKYTEQIKNGTIQSAFGNIDMDKRTIITWSDELKKTYKDALDSWVDEYGNPYNPEIGGIDTVFGGSESFEFGDTEYEIAFSPILQTDDGAVFLDKHNTEEYIYSVLDEVNAGINANGDAKTEDIIKEILRIDAEGTGYEYGGKLVKGLIAGAADWNDENAGNDVVDIGSLMHFSGNYGAIKLANDRIAEAQEKVNKTYADGTQIADEYLQKMGINTQEELDHFNEVTKGAKTATEAINMYEKSLAGDANKNAVSWSISEMVDNLNERLKPTFDSLKSAYANIFKVDDGTTTFSLDDVDVSTFESIKSAIDKFNEIDGINIDYSSYEEFVKVLSNTDSTAEEVQEQFNRLSSAIIWASDCTKMSDETFDLLVKSLYEMGNTNAEEVLTNIKNAQIELTNAGYDLSNITLEQAQAFMAEAKASGTAKEYLRWYMVQKQLANKPLDSKADVAALENICKGLGVTGKMMQAVVSLKSAMGAVEAGVSPQAYQSQIDNAKAEIERLANGEGFDFKFNFNPNVTSPSKSKSSGSGKSSSSEKTPTVETFDFIETAIARCESRLESFKTTAENAYESIAKRNRAYADAINDTTNEISLQQQAYQAYINKANSFGLNETYAQKVRNGSISIEDITDDVLKSQIKNYQTYYEKAIEALNKVGDLQKSLKELQVSKIQLEVDVNTNELNRLESNLASIQNKIDLKDAWGFSASAKDYQKLDSLLSKEMARYITINRYLEQQKSLVDRGSAQWYEYQKSIDANNASIQELTKSMAENAKTASELINNKSSKKVEKIDSADELLRARLQNTDSYNNQNSIVDEEIKNIRRRMKAYDSAVSSNKSALSSSIKAIKKSKAGKALMKQIKSYTKAKKEIPASVLNTAMSVGDNGRLYERLVRYNAALAAYQTSADTANLYRENAKQEKVNLVKEKSDNIATYYENRRKAIEQRGQELNDTIAIIEAQGYSISNKYYNNLIQNEQKNNKSLTEERKKLQEQLKAGLKSGAIEVNSAEYYELQEQIDNITNSINDSTKSLIEYQNQLRQLKWDNFDKLEERISRVASESDFLINEISRQDLTDKDTGKLNDAGNAVLGLRASNYTTYTEQAKDYAKQIKSINKELEKDPYNKTLIERKEALVDAYQKAISGAQEEKYAMLDLVKTGYQAAIDKIGDLISKYLELLDRQKDNFEYSKKLNSQLEEINALRKQMVVYAGDISEEGRSKAQQVNKSLKDAEDSLQESQYDRMIEMTKQMLEDLQQDLSDSVDSIIESLETNFDELLAKISADNTIVSDIKEQMKGIGYTTTTDFKNVLNDTDIVSATKDAITAIENLEKSINAYSGKNKGASSGDTVSSAQKSEMSSLKKKATSEKENRDSLKHNRDLAKENYDAAVKKYGKKSKQAKDAKFLYDDAKSKYNKSNAKYKALNYLLKHLSPSTKSKNDYSALNQALYSGFSGMVLTSKEAKELAELLGVKYSTKSSGALYKKLKELGINGFKVGSRNIPYNQLALLAEEGTELHFSNKYGTLKPVGQGDMIFTNEMAQNLWKLSQVSPSELIRGLNVNVPTVKRTSSGNVSIEMGDIILPKVTNAQEFAAQLKDVVKNDSSVQNMLKDSTIGTLNKGHNSLSNRRF